MKLWKLKNYRHTWTNWTFGLWWGRLGSRDPMHFGVDLGPWEWVFVRLDKQW